MLTISDMNDTQMRSTTSHHQIASSAKTDPRYSPNPSSMMISAIALTAPMSLVSAPLRSAPLPFHFLFVLMGTHDMRYLLINPHLPS